MRKKTFAYDVDLSRTLTILTWQVGRELTIRKGHFYRRELTDTIHSIAKTVIDRGFTTKTRVNRCLQALLKSCFEYVACYDESSRASGQAFSSIFLRQVDDSATFHLYKQLSPTWREGLNRHCASSGGLTVDSTHDYDKDKFTGAPMGFKVNIRSYEALKSSLENHIVDIAARAKLKPTGEEWSLFFDGNKDRADHFATVGTEGTSSSTDSPHASNTSTDIDTSDDSFEANFSNVTVEANDSDSSERMNLETEAVLVRPSNDDTFFLHSPLKKHSRLPVFESILPTENSSSRIDSSPVPYFEDEPETHLPGLRSLHDQSNAVFVNCMGDPSTVPIYSLF